MNMKFMEKPVYETVDIIGKTMETVTGTVDRKVIGRVLITKEAGFAGAHQVVGGDETPIRTVSEIGDGEGFTDPVKVFVELVGGVRSAASYTFFSGYTAENAENKGVIDLYTEDCDKVNRVVAVAGRMSGAHPECDGQWQIVTEAGTRIFLRKITKNLTSTGRAE